jgi:hypothetical protein
MIPLAGALPSELFEVRFQVREISCPSARTSVSAYRELACPQSAQHPAHAEGSREVFFARRSALDELSP